MTDLLTSLTSPQGRNPIRVGGDKENMSKPDKGRSRTIDSDTSSPDRIMLRSASIIVLAMVFFSAAASAWETDVPAAPDSVLREVATEHPGYQARIAAVKAFQDMTDVLIQLKRGAEVKFVEAIIRDGQASFKDLEPVTVSREVIREDPVTETVVTRNGETIKLKGTARLAKTTQVLTMASGTLYYITATYTFSTYAWTMRPSVRCLVDLNVAILTVEDVSKPAHAHLDIILYFWSCDWQTSSPTSGAPHWGKSTQEAKFGYYLRGPTGPIQLASIYKKAWVYLYPDGHAEGGHT